MTCFRSHFLLLHHSTFSTLRFLRFPVGLQEPEFMLCAFEIGACKNSLYLGRIASYQLPLRAQ